MIHGCPLTPKVILYTNSFATFNREGLHCRRLKYIFEQYQSVAPLTLMDINSDLIEAISGKQSAAISRIDLAEKLGLVKSGKEANELKLPQAFLILEQKSKILNKQIEISKCFIGDYETCVYLEDSGLLNQILTGNVCTHYRTFNLRVYFSFNKAVGCENCNQCSPDDSKVVVQTNYRDSTS